MSSILLCDIQSPPPALHSMPYATTPTPSPVACAPPSFEQHRAKCLKVLSSYILLDKDVGRQLVNWNDKVRSQLILLMEWLDQYFEPWLPWEGLNSIAERPRQQEHSSNDFLSYILNMLTLPSPVTANVSFPSSKGLIRSLLMHNLCRV